MIYLLEVKLPGSKWLPREILDESDIHQALNNLKISPRYHDWRIRRVSKDDVSRINAQIVVQWGT